MGDEAILDTWRYRFPSVRFLNSPLYRQDLGHFLRSRVEVSRARMPVVLGGGTTLGIRSWADHVRRAQKLALNSTVHVVGAGGIDMNDPEGSGNQEVDLDAWRNINGIICHGVRGPDSAVLAKDLGLNADILGDTALLLPELVDLPTTRTTNTLGCFLGRDAGHEFQVSRLARLVDSIVQTVGARRVQFFAASPRDLELNYEVAACVNAIADVRPAYETQSAYAGISECSIVLAQRLHGAVLAASVGVPVIGLAYQTKVVDFFRSLDAEDAVISFDHPLLSDESSVHGVLEAAHREGVAERVVDHQESLARAFDRVELAIVKSH